MLSTPTEEILNYWNGLRGPRPAPMRSEIDPAALRHYLPHLFIITAILPGETTFALAGTRICELFDRELRNHDYDTIWNAAAGDQSAEIIDKVLFYERAAIVDVRLQPAGSGEAEEHPYDMLLMPMRSSGRRSDRILGALVPRKGAIPPILLPIRSLSLRGWGFVRPDGGQPEMTDGSHRQSVEQLTFFRRLAAGAGRSQAGR